MIDLNLLFGIVPALILFLYGIENFSREIQVLAGDKFRSIIATLTKTPVRGSFLGAVITALVQSSTATTVITVSLVNAGILSFTQSLGVMFGANIGTTVTAQLVAFKLTSFAPAFIILGFAFKFLSRKTRILWKPVFFFGLVFYGLMLVSSAIEPLKADPYVMEIFSNLSNVFIALAAGFIFTTIVQSSSVTTGLIVVLAQNGLIDLTAGIPLLLGANIGTSTTALLASLGLNLHAKRAGIANALFNLGGVVLFFPFLGIFTILIQSMGGTAAQQIANAHMIFNIAVAAVFLLVINKFRQFIEEIVPGKEEEILFKTKYIPEELPENSTAVFKLIKKELSYSIEVTQQIYEESLKLFKYPKKKGFFKLEKLEALNDFLDEEITHAILQVSNRELDKIGGKKTVLLVQISNAIEQLGDLGEDLGDVSKDLFEKGINMSYESIEAVDKIYRKMRLNLELMEREFPYFTKKQFRELKQREEEIMDLINERYKEHLERLQEEREYKGSTFVESVSIMENSISKLREIRKFCEKYTELK